MLSILIPTYNYDITPLVKELSKQCIMCNVKFEILVFDDGSKSKLNSTNQNINAIDHCTFKELPINIGRSATRNLLANESKYNTLLFIDAGTFPKHSDFIKKYLSINDKVVLSGGMTHLKLPPNKPYKLRWLFTKTREYKVLCSSNFMIKKIVFSSNSFDETLKEYGYEDVLFFQNLSKKNIDTFFFNNPVIHGADDDANTFIKKTEFAIKNLINLLDDAKIDKNDQKIYRVFSILKKLKLVSFTNKLHNLLKPLFLKNFNSSYASILLFDLYKIGYFCYLKQNK
ncbi:MULTISPECIES: glycosyltransferase [unclassified Algibacter]|uniref:glycosyltransferase n=1 Tax=unclassified Algibacter TaxID=2615009 RepID=UPI00131A8AF9|nr:MULTISPECIES: glycosyltransferase [unclassified Algibacter]MCL5129970.1 glycosyltransferase [Algibacter sp. L4_22]